MTALTLAFVLSGILTIYLDESSLTPSQRNRAAPWGVVTAGVGWCGVIAASIDALSNG